ncbi:MAG TPA: hypothetical protein DCS91_11650 [Microcoleaceae bacterium UBA11344]|nr:hypothetical protein [Microcoleaceae cyanobacterium UBA11344]
MCIGGVVFYFTSSSPPLPMTQQRNLNPIAQNSIDPKQLEKLVKLSCRSLWVSAVLGLTFPIFTYFYTKRRLAFYIALLLCGLMSVLTVFIVSSREIPNGSTLPGTAFYTFPLLFSLGITVDNCAAILRARKKVELLTGETPWKKSNNQQVILLGFITFLAALGISHLSQNPEARLAINSPTPTTNVPDLVIAEQTPALPTAPISQPLPPTSPTVESDSFGDAVNKATNAANLAGSAQSDTQWRQVVAEWQNAIALMKSVPPSSSNYDVAQNRVGQYQQNLATIKRRINRPFQQGIDAAQNAAFFAQTAKSKAEWESVASQWDQAIAFMKSVPQSNPNYAVAQNRVVLYQQNLNAARLAVSRAK